MIDFKQIIGEKIANIAGLDLDEITTYIEIPPNRELGDYAFPCFKLAKILKQSPQIIANDLKEKVKPDDTIEKVEIVGGYLNFYINKLLLTKTVLEKIESEKEEYGKSSIGNGKTVLVEYSSPNIAKPFHIGHLRTTVIGKSLYNIYKFLGYNTIGINHLGDYGTQFGKMIEGYKKWGQEYNLDVEPIEKLMNIYIRINDLCKEDENVLNACRDNFKKLEEKDEYCTEIWNKFKDLSLKEFNKIYNILDVKFDSMNGEAFYSDKMDEILDILTKNNVLVESDGATIIDLEDKGLRSLYCK